MQPLMLMLMLHGNGSEPWRPCSKCTAARCCMAMVLLLRGGGWISLIVALSSGAGDR